MYPATHARYIMIYFVPFSCVSWYFVVLRVIIIRVILGLVNLYICYLCLPYFHSDPSISQHLSILLVFHISVNVIYVLVPNFNAHSISYRFIIFYTAFSYITAQHMIYKCSVLNLSNDHKYYNYIITQAP